MWKKCCSLLAVFLLMPVMASAVDTAAPIPLPGPSYSGAVSVEEALQRRRSVRRYKDEPITLQQAAQLLWAAQGITAGHKRAAPSAGALYPLTVYLVSGAVESLPAGVYRYVPDGHALVPVSSGDKRQALAAAALRQGEVAAGAADIVITAVYKKTTRKYSHRGRQYVHMEAGHAAENICLQAVSLGLGTVTIGAFHDAAVQSALEIPGEEVPLYILPVGKP